ncbi:hypothetical protein PsorP6_013001 [Peronosclerospora sorghi]|uniref:Uncharacterized protein n=1 Tax=Peronosclerospora sorghi TaxID=230839 RepID=A0ACC0WIY0_9STRA|nr:hypothetical protein PsorP6_013001 [Peronosclerospora sorghi]
MDAKYKLRIFAILKLYIPDLSDAVPRLLMLGAIMDGPIKYPAHGKTAAFRSPDGVMIGLYEPNSWDDVTSV